MALLKGYTNIINTAKLEAPKSRFVATAPYEVMVRTWVRDSFYNVFIL